MTVVSADWVVPVEGPPIRDGAVAIDDSGRIAAVGARAELGEGVHYDEAVILPGFVNAHTHLEYDVYAGFGDGLGFADWIGLHVQRKARIDLADMEAIARLGALHCLASGITTVGDCSFSGAAAVACADLGLRGTIYLEVFGASDEPIRERFEPMRERIAGALSDDVRLGISPHAPYTCTIELYRAAAEVGVPVATHLAESAAETEFLRTGGGAWASFAEMLVPPPGTTGIRALAEAGLLERERRRGALRGGGRRGDRAPRRARRRRRALPALERDARLRRRSPRRAAGGGDPRVHRDRQPRIDTLVRHVRRDARGDRRGARPRTATGRAHRGGRARARHARRCPRARARRRRSDRSCPESRPI